MKKQCLIIAAFLTMGNVAVNGQETLPFTQDFYDSATFNKMTLIDSNNDGYKWNYSSYSFPSTYSSAARYSPNSANGADDWMITPGFELKAGYIYNLSFKAAGATGYTNNIDAMIGKEATAEALTTSLMSTVVLTEKVGYTYQANVSVAEDGIYYIGLHITSEASQGYVYVDDLVLTTGILADAPAAAHTLSATPAVENGKAVMKLSFVAPKVTNSNESLNEITNIIVYRGTTKIADLGATTPGATVEYTDEAPIVGSNAYRVICVNNAGEGNEANVSATLSFSLPAAPANVVLTQENGVQTITWEPVTTTASSTGLFFKESITYTVTRSDKVEIAKGLKECKITDNYTKEGEGQDLVYYNVVAVNEGGASTASASNKILMGNPYTGEYAESFANYKYTTNTWQVVGGSGTIWQTKTSSYYSPAISADQDGNNGFIAFSSYTSGMEQRLVSPVINVSNMQNPRLSFYMYHAATSYTDKVVPELLINGEYVALHEGITVNGTVEGWTKYNFDLTKEQTAGNIQLSFNGIAGGGYLIAIDNITIKDALSHNLAVTGVTTPANLAIGKEENIVVSVKNTGVNVANDYKVVLSCDGAVIAEANGTELASEASAEVAFAFVATPFAAEKELNFSTEVVYAADLNAEDNTASATVSVISNELPVPTALTATENSSSIALAWTAPVVPEVQVQDVMTESFEAWTAGSTEPFAGWKFVDADGYNTYNYAYYEVSGAMAFLTTSSTNVPALTGSNYLVSIKNNSYRDYRNDWAISPEVVDGQTISFSVYQHGGYGYYGTTFEVCYSTTDNNVESFEVLEKVTDKSSSWKQYSFTLPENTKYFAIHVTDDGSSTSTAMAIDDITFQPGSTQLVHTGYNVYRDAQLIASINDKTTVTYEDANMADDAVQYEYAVSAVYESGESLASDTVVVVKTVTSIEDVDNSKAIYATQGALNVCGYAGETLQVYTLAGQLVASKTVSNNDTVALAAGIYVAKVADKHVKVIVK